MNSFTPHKVPELVLSSPLYRRDKWGIKGLRNFADILIIAVETLKFKSKQSHSRPASPDHQTTHCKAVQSRGERKSGEEIMSGLTIS